LESTLYKIYEADREGSEVHKNLINNMEAKTYEERLHSLKLWTLEERRNRQDLINVFRMCNGLLRLEPIELFTYDDNIRTFL